MQSLFNYRDPVDFPFCFKLYQESYTLLKHSHLLACVVVCIFCKTIFWKHPVCKYSMKFGKFSMCLWIKVSRGNCYDTLVYNRERVLRLEHENKKLKEQMQGEQEEQVSFGG